MLLLSGDDVVIDADYISSVDIAVTIDIDCIASEARSVAFLYVSVDGHHVSGIDIVVLIGIGAAGKVALAHDMLEATPARGVDYG